MQPLRTTALALALLLPIAACDGAGSDPKALTDAGQSALRGGDWAEAQDRFDAAAAATDETAPTWLQASLGSIRAQAHTDAAQAQERFLALAKRLGDRLQIVDYADVATELADAGKIPEAAHVADAAKKAFPDHADKIEGLIKRLVADAKARAAQGDTSGLDALKGLGYVGGGD